MTPEILVRRIETQLGKYAFAFHDEIRLHEGIAKVLAAADLPFEREVAESKRDRFDFLVDGSVVIEVKVDGSFADAAIQVSRYLDHERVRAVVVATSKPWDQCGMTVAAKGKTVTVVRIRRRAL